MTPRLPLYNVQTRTFPPFFKLPYFQTKPKKKTLFVVLPVFYFAMSSAVPIGCIYMNVSDLPSNNSTFLSLLKTSWTPSLLVGCS